MLTIWEFVNQLVTSYPKEKRPMPLDIFSPQSSQFPSRLKNDARMALISCDYLEILFRGQLDLPVTNYNLPYELVIQRFEDLANTHMDQIRHSFDEQAFAEARGRLQDSNYPWFVLLLLFRAGLHSIAI